MKRMIASGLVLVCLLLAVGCGREEEKPVPVVPPPAAQRDGAARTPAVEVPAVPAAGPYTLTYAAAANGTVEGPSPQVVSAGESGKPVTAVPAAGYRFAGWSDGSTANPRSDAGVTANLAVTADFAVLQYRLSYAAGEHGSITGSATQTVSHGSAGKPVTATPAAGYHFSGWSDGSTANPRSDAGVTAELAVTAAFAINQYTLTYSAEEHGSITGATPQSVTHGGDGTPVTAVPAAGYQFVAWSDGVTTAERVDAGVTGDLAVTAGFAPRTYTVGGKLAGLAEGNEAVLQNGEEELTVGANGDFAFVSTFPDGSPYAVAVKTQPTSPNQTCTVSAAAGTIAGADVDGIRVECRYNLYTVGGTVTGLPDGNQIVLRNNQGDDLTIGAKGKFVFATPLNDGSAYQVTIHSQKLRPKWFCSVEKAAGSLAGGNVTGVDVGCFPEAELLAVPGLGSIDLTWNSKDFRGVTFNLCRARQDIERAGFARCTELADGVREQKVSSPHGIGRLVNGVHYWLQLEVQHPGGRRTYSQVASATPYGGLNDTGVDWCVDHSNRSREGTRADKTTACEAIAVLYPGQDAHQGRDAAIRLRKLSKSGSGSAGFDFTKVCGNGKLAGEGNCPPNPTLAEGDGGWACIRDNVTGLYWEVKTARGLRGQENLYSWYNPDGAANGGAPGVQNGGRCEGSGCDTSAYVQAVNQQKLCGAGDWRLPTRKELLSIVDNGRYKPAIDTDYFPNTPSAHFWTSSPYADQAGSAWQVYFQYGEALPEEKGKGARIRLVRRDK